MMGMGGGHGGQPGVGGLPDTEWRSEAFRSSLRSKLEEAIRESGSQNERNAVDLERQVFQRANSKEEYLSFVARLILHVKQQAGGGQRQQGQQQGGPGPGGDMMGGGMRNMGGGGQVIMNQQQMQQGGMNPGMQQQHQQQMMQQQQQQRMMQMNQMQQQQVRGGPMMMQRPGMSQLEQRLQQQQQQQGPMMMGPRGPMPMQPHPRMHGMPMGGPRVPPPNYMQGPSPGGGMPGPGSSPMQHQGPSPIPTYQGASPGQMQQPSPGGMINSMNPSPSSNVNTPLAAPASQEDREYLEKVKSLEKYIEPLRNMIAKIGDNDQDRLIKMKKLLDILSNPGRRMQIQTLLKCEDVLKRMNLETVEPDSKDGKDGASNLNPLLEAVVKIKQNSNTANLNHALSNTFLPPCHSFMGSPISLPPLPPSPAMSDEEDEGVPDVLQGEIARLEPRYKVWLDPAQPSGDTGSIQLVCQLDDKDLPSVPHINVTIPQDYPESPPRYQSQSQDYLRTPFLDVVQTAFNSRLLQLPQRHTLSQLLTAWELSVRSACSPSASQHNNIAVGVLSGL